MVPIYEQGQGNGIGHSFSTLVNRFIGICKEHLDNRRAQAFAFLLYNFHDKSVKAILKNRGGFTKLDRLSGKDLSIFYLHSGDRNLLKQFNSVFLRAFEVDHQKNRLPLMLFFKITDSEVTGIEIVELEQNNLMFAFNELYDIIQNYIDRLKDKNVTAIVTKTNRVTEFLEKAKKVAIDRFLKLLMDKAIEYGDKFI